LDTNQFILKEWHQIGIVRINDIVNERGEIMGWNEMREILGEKGHFLQHAAISKAIPKTWKTQIRHQGKKLDNIKHLVLNKIQKLAKPNRYAYTNLITEIVTNPTTSQGKWAEYLETDIVDMVHGKRYF
jgi:hypothetical protein